MDGWKLKSLDHYSLGHLKVRLDLNAVTLKPLMEGEAYLCPFSLLRVYN